MVSARSNILTLRAEQQGQSHDEKTVRVAHLSRPGNGLYHSLGKLPEPETTHRVGQNCRRATAPGSGWRSARRYRDGLTDVGGCLPSPGPGFRWTVHWEHLLWKMF
jgi:hypothetical protein